MRWLVTRYTELCFPTKENSQGAEEGWQGNCCCCPTPAVGCTNCNTFAWWWSGPTSSGSPEFQTETVSSPTSRNARDWPWELSPVYLKHVCYWLATDIQHYLIPQWFWVGLKGNVIWRALLVLVRGPPNPALCSLTVTNQMSMGNSTLDRSLGPHSAVLAMRSWCNLVWCKLSLFQTLFRSLWKELLLAKHAGESGPETWLSWTGFRIGVKSVLAPLLPPPCSFFELRHANMCYVIYVTHLRRCEGVTPGFLQLLLSRGIYASIAPSDPRLNQENSRATKATPSSWLLSFDCAARA